MKIITGSTGTAHVTSNNAGELNQAIFGTGNIVPNIGNHLAATLVNNNTINIADGDIVIQGRHALIEAGMTETLSINTGNVGYNRNDLIVARYAIDSGTGYESVSLVVIQGTETTGTASDPTYNTGDIRTGSTVVDVPLYRVVLEGVNVTAVTALFTPTAPIADNIYTAGTAIQINNGAIGVRFGTSSTTACRGNDSRLSDAREPLAHTQAASTITAGELGGKVQANGTAVANLANKQVRNIYAGTTDMTAGVSALTTGDIYIVYE